MRLIKRTGVFFQTLIVVALVRAGLTVSTHQRLRRVLVRACAPDPQTPRTGTVKRIRDDVRRAAQWVPAASCLTQSIACQAMLSWQGIPSTVSLGVRSDGTGMAAHAWLVWNGAIILEGDDDTPRQFRKILDLPTPPTAPRTP